MRQIELETWYRRGHFEFFRDWGYPHFNLCANIDLTAFCPYVKQAANAVPEFRQRIRDGGVVEHDVVHAGTTILVDDNMFTFCYVDYCEDFNIFAERAAEAIAAVKENRALESDPAADDRIYMTAIPWVSFTGFMHPLNLDPVDSIPRFAWGKFFKDGDCWKMPLSVQAHHALADGIHAARLYDEVQRCLDDPAATLGAG